MITALLWAIALSVVVIPYRNSGQPIGAILKGQELSARNNYSPRNSPEERSSQLERTSGSSFKSPQQNPVCIFQITSFTQIPPPKPFFHLTNYLFPSNLPTKTLYASSKLPISFKFPH